MRRLSTTILALALASVCATAQLVWEPDVLDFGTVSEADGIATREFSARNAGADTIAVERVVSSCGCTTSAFSARALAPGDTLRLPVSYNPSFRPGRFEKQITVVTDDTLRYRLTIKGKVTPTRHTVDKLFPSKAGPMRLTSDKIALGEVKQGHNRTMNAIAYNNSADTLLLCVGGAPDGFSVSVSPATLPPGETASVSVTLRCPKNAPIGLNEWRAELTANGKTAATLSVAARVVAERNSPAALDSNAPRISAASDRVDFSPISANAVSKAEITVANKGKSTLKISDVAAATDAIAVKKFPKKIKPGKTGKIILELDGSKLGADVLNSSIAIFSNDPANMTLQIRAVGAAGK